MKKIKLPILNSKVNLKNKTILLRIDINAQIENNKPVNAPRFKQAAQTIQILKKRGAKVVCIAHQGRKGKKDYCSLKKHAKILSKYTKVTYIPDLYGTKAKNAIEKLKPKQVILLENLRSTNDETTPSKRNNKLLTTIAPLCEIYINDAFSSSHRNHTSITKIPQKLPTYFGPNFNNEYKIAQSIHKTKNKLFILGGNKIEDIIDITNNNKSILTGTISLYALNAFGYNLNKQVSTNKQIEHKLKQNHKNLIIPTDLAILKNNKREEITIQQLPTNNSIFDIGKQTTNNIKKRIQNTNLVIIKGPFGKIEDKRFKKATTEIFKYIHKNDIQTIVAGGNSTTILGKTKKSKSTPITMASSGGALIYYILHNTLPGIEVVKQ